MAPTMLDLKTNREYINPDFDGYKLSLQEIPTTKKDLCEEIDRTIASATQYGFLHAKLFNTHNHLTGESINDTDVTYYVDKSWKIQKVVHDPNGSSEIEITEVFQVPKLRERSPGDYNVTFKFIGDNFAIISDGIGTLYLVDTKLNGNIWEVVYSEEVLGEGKVFVIQDAILRNKEIVCMLYSITAGEEDRFLNVFNVVTLSKSCEDTWVETSIKELTAPGNVYYAAIERYKDALYIASEKSFKFTLDSNNPVICEQKQDEQKIYIWTQTKDDICIKFKIPDIYEKEDIDINVTNSEIFCKFKSQEFLKGKLFAGVLENLTNWIVNGNALEITLIKAEEGYMWPELIPGDTTGEYLTDPSVIADVHERLAHLCGEKESNDQVGTTYNSQQVEECDFELDKFAVFERLCCVTHETTHKLNIDSHKVILTVQHDSNCVPAVAFRHDVDAFIWQPTFEDDAFTLKHIGTLNAFGYVEASKQQKKFTVCAPDLSYSVVCESLRHVFIYRQKKSVDSGELRNRITGQHIGFIAQQQVIAIPNDEILGIYASNYKLFILTTKTIYVLRM